MDDRPGGARVPRGHPRRGRAAVQYALRQRRRDRGGRRAVDQRGLPGKHRTRAVAGWGPDACGQHPHRARQGALRGTARSAGRDGRRGAPGRLLADDRGDRQLRTTAMSLSPPLPSSFQLASDEVHSCCASLDVPPETSARPYATLTPDERTRSASDAPRGARALITRFHKYDQVCCGDFRFWRGATREHPPQWGCDRGATKPEPKSDATLRAAVLFGPDVVARSLQTPEGYARRSRLVRAKNPSPQTCSYL